MEVHRFFSLVVPYFSNSNLIVLSLLCLSWWHCRQIPCLCLTWGEPYFLIKPIRWLFLEFESQEEQHWKKKIKGDVLYLWQPEMDKKNKRCILRFLLPSASWTLKERKEWSLRPVLKSFYSRDFFLFSHSKWNQILFNLLGETEKWIICTLLWILENVWPLVYLQYMYHGLWFLVYFWAPSGDGFFWTIWSSCPLLWWLALCFRVLQLNSLGYYW